MIEVTRILCPVDFSEGSGHALEYAAAIARWYGASVTALHVFPTHPSMNAMSLLARGGAVPISLSEADREELTRHLTAFGERHGRGTAVEALLLEGPIVHREITRQAAALDADLIVMGSHGRTGFERLLLGSVTEKTLRTAGCPVMVIPPRAPDAAHSEAPRFHRILCPVDFSDGSLAAVTYALSLAEENDAKLTLLHVIEMPIKLAGEPAVQERDLTHLRLAAEAASLRRLRELIPASARTYCTIETAVEEGRPAREILSVAAARGNDLIVMGVEGRGAVDLLVFGSNTHHVVRSASCPVLTVPAARRS